MSMLQHYKQVTQEKILEIDKDTTVLPRILLEEKNDVQLDIDKSWDGIHFLLTGEIIGEKVDQSDPRTWIIFGWGEWGPEVGYGPSRVVPPKEVAQLAKFLSTLNDEDLRKRFDPVKMNKLGLYPGGIWDEESVLDWLMDHYHKVKDFYIDAAKKGNGVLIWTT
ncbi:MAG: YfbM family protein [bacterium]|nr:YfbM family protein [bacterium]